jgi:hypothetical protein
VSKTVSIPKDLSHRCDWRTCRSRRGILNASKKIVEKFSVVLGFLSLPTPPRDPSVDFRAFSLNTVKMDLTLSSIGGHLIPNDIFERGLISIEILPITTLLAVIEWETGLVPPSIEALIRTKTIVGITNEVDILGDRRAVDAHVACFSTLFTHYFGINHFEMIEAQVLKLLHNLFKLVNLPGVGLSALLIPALVRGHFLNQFMSFLNTESEERTSSSSI